MEDKAKRPFGYYLRVWHRNIGFFVVGLVLVYALSGVVLTYRDREFLNREVRIEKKIAPGLSATELGDALRIKGFAVSKTEGEVVHFRNGTYNTTSGAVAYTIKEPVFPMNKFIKLHKTNSSGSASWFTTLFGASLAFLAITSFWMVPRGSGLFRRAMITATGGFLLLIVLLSL